MFEDDQRDFGDKKYLTIPAWFYTVHRLQSHRWEYISSTYSWSASDKNKLAICAHQTFNEKLAEEGAPFRLDIKYSTSINSLIYTVDYTNYTGEESDDLLNI